MNLLDTANKLQTNNKSLAKAFTQFLGVMIVVALGGPPASTLMAQEVIDESRWVVTSLSGEPLPIGGDAGVQGWVVCFLGTECPMARQYAPMLARKQQDWGDKGIRLIGVSSNAQDTIEDWKEFVADTGITFPIGKDYDNRVADQVGAKRTPEVFFLDRDLNVIYNGAIDDQFEPGIVKAKANRHFLDEAIEQWLAKEPISTPRTEATGCLIGRVKQAQGLATVTYARDVAPILQRHCVECHREGEIGPFALDNYDSAQGWAEMSIEVIDNGRMPPWHADPHVGSFQNERLMPEADKAILRQWLAEGAVFGSADELPPPAQFTTGWRLPREPDQIIAMRETPFEVPADGVVEYQYFVVDPKFDRDRWVTAAEVIPGDRRVVHHSIVFVRPPDGAAIRGIGWLAAYVPGQSPPEYVPHRGRLVPAGSKLVFQQHYTPTGSAAQDLTQIGLVFGDESEIEEELVTLVGIDQEFEIPPYAAEYQVRGDIGWKPSQGQLLNVAPHMHYRGKSFELFRSRQGAVEPLLKVPHYDFNWQHSYRFTEPIALSEIEGLPFTMTYDNSIENPFNPDPSQVVTWGDQTWEEMAVAFFDVAFPREAQMATPLSLERRERRQPNPGSGGVGDDAMDGLPGTAERELQIEREAREFLNEFDHNGDEVVLPNETPAAFRHFGFQQYDLDRDGRLTLAEIRESFRKSFKPRNP